MKNNCIYFVEGKCEAALLAALKERPQKIVSGRVKIFNVIGNLIPRSQLVTIQAGTTIVFVKDFKRDFCAMTNCRDVLDRHQLDVLRLWTQNPPEVFRFIPSNSKIIKL